MAYICNHDYEMAATFIKLLWDKNLINDANKHEID